MAAVIDQYLRQVGLGCMSCHQLGSLCVGQDRPRPREFDDLSLCVGHNAERDLHRRSA